MKCFMLLGLIRALCFYSAVSASLAFDETVSKLCSLFFRGLRSDYFL